MFLLAGISGQVFYAQTPPQTLEFSGTHHKKVSFRFDLANNLIIIPVIINDSDTLHFILDTGINNPIISELSLGDSLSLHYTRQIKLNGLGNGEPVDALISEGNTFTLHGMKTVNQKVFVLLQNIFNLSQILGKRVQGLIGYNIFSQHIVRFNYERKIITLYNPANYVYKPRKQEVTLPLIVSNKKPYLYASIIDEKGKSVKVKLLIDSGASHGLWLIPGSREGITFPSKVADAYLGSGLSGRINGKLGRIPELDLGPFVFKQPVVAFPDTFSMRDISYHDGRNGTLGSEILRRFDVTLDYLNHRIILRPNRYYKDPFTVNRAGITLTAPIPGISYYIISDIRKESPAARAGLKKGDKLDKINGSYVSHMSMDKIYKVFYGKPGKRIKMEVIRHGLRFVTYFYLADFI